MLKPTKWCEPCGRLRSHRHEKCPYCGGALLAERPAVVVVAGDCSTECDRLEEIRMAMAGDLPGENPYRDGTIESTIYKLRRAHTNHP